MTHENTEGSRTARTVVSTAPTATTNMTGVLTRWRGSSLRNASGSDCTSCAGLNAPLETRCGAAGSGWVGAGVLVTVLTTGLQ